MSDGAADASTPSGQAAPRSPADGDLRDRPDWAGAPEGGDESLMPALLKMVLVLGLVLAAVYVTLNFGLRRLMQMPVRQGIVKVHERVALDQKKAVFVVEVAGEYLLLGGGEQQVALIARLDPEQARAALARQRPAPSASGKPFLERLLHKPPPRDKEGGAS